MTTDLAERLLAHAAAIDDPAEAIWALLEEASDGLGASSAKLYVKDLARADFAQAYELLDSQRIIGDTQKRISISELAASQQSAMAVFFRHAFQSNSPAWFTINENIRSKYLSSSSASVAFIPIYRSSCQVGLLLLESSAEVNWRKFRTELSVVQSILVLLLEKRTALSLLRAIYQPVDFDTTQEEFLEEILRVAAHASGMNYIALRELSFDRQSLRCLKLVGFADSADPSLMDLSPVSSFPPFEQALQGETVPVATTKSPELEPLLPLIEPDGIRSFVVAPVRVGSSVFGTVSFASRLEHTYTQVEMAGLDTIANALGIAIRNFRSARDLGETTRKNTEAGLAYTALEVAQAARHDLRASLDNAQLKLTLVRSALDRKKDIKEGIAGIDDCASFLKAIDESINKIRDASRINRGVREVASIRKIWGEAKRLCDTKSQLMGVDISIDGDARVPMYENLMRLALFNLIQNSLDAFARRRGQKSGGRMKIKLTIHPPKDDDKWVDLRYFDNAGGLDVALLTQKKISEGYKRTIGEYIFELGITTRDGGSGYGLYLVRRAFQDHDGSIDLVDYRDGCTFDMRLQT